MATFNQRLHRIEKAAPPAKDARAEQLQTAFEQLTNNELRVAGTISDFDEMTPAQQAVLQRLETLMAEQHG